MTQAQLLSALPWGLLTLAIWVSFALVRRYAPKLWVVPGLHALYDKARAAIPDEFERALVPVLNLAWSTWEAVPAVLVGAIFSTLRAGGDVKQAWIGALAGAAAPVWHHLMKLLPFVPYQGALGEMKKEASKPPSGPWFPPGVAVLFVAVTLCLPFTTGCSSKPEVAPCDPATLAKIVATCTSEEDCNAKLDERQAFCTKRIQEEK